jgi:hypothetical protein
LKAEKLTCDAMRCRPASSVPANLKEVTHRPPFWQRRQTPTEPSLSLNIIEQEVLSTASLEGGEAHEDVVIMEVCEQSRTVTQHGMVKGAIVGTTVTAKAAVVAHRSDCGG